MFLLKVFVRCRFAAQICAKMCVRAGIIFVLVKDIDFELRFQWYRLKIGRHVRFLKILSMFLPKDFVRRRFVAQLDMRKFRHARTFWRVSVRRSDDE